MSSSNFYFLIFAGIIYYLANKHFNEKISIYHHAISGLKIENEKLRTQLSEVSSKCDYFEELSIFTKSTLSTKLDGKITSDKHFESSLQEMISEAYAKNDMETIKVLEKVSALLQEKYKKEIA